MSEIELNNIGNLLNNVGIIKKKYEDIAEYTGENFNVFNILGLYSSELSHSAFIGNLLNAKGKHGQKDVFLKLFLSKLNNVFQDNNRQKIIDDFKTLNSSVIIEKHIDYVNYENQEGGRIDIVINDGKNNIILENKIWASDPPQQLKRYYNYDKKAPLIYLTLFGNEPSKESKDDLNFKEHFICLSYADFIVEWIENCIKEMSNKPIIRETLNQYLHLVNQLTNKSNNKKMEKDIINQVINNKQNLNSYLELLNNQNSIRKEILEEDLINQVIKKLENDFDLNLKIDDGIYYGNIYHGFEFHNEKLGEKNICIRIDYQAGNFQNPLFGFLFLDKTKNNEFVVNEIFPFFEKKFGKTFTNENFATYIINSKWTASILNLGSWNNLLELRFEKKKEEIYNDLKLIISQMLEII